MQKNSNFLSESWLIYPKVWPTSDQAFSQPNRWTLVWKAMWPSTFIKVVFHQEKSQPQLSQQLFTLSFYTSSCEEIALAHSSWNGINLPHGKQNQHGKWPFSSNKWLQGTQQSHWYIQCWMSMQGHSTHFRKRGSQIDTLPFSKYLDFFTIGFALMCVYYTVFSLRIIIDKSDIGSRFKYALI